MGTPAKERIVVFDVEGVIIPKEQFLLFYVLRRIGLAAFVGGALIGLLYTAGLLYIGNALKGNPCSPQGIPREGVHFPILENIPDA